LVTVSCDTLLAYLAVKKISQSEGDPLVVSERLAMKRTFMRSDSVGVSTIILRHRRHHRSWCRYYSHHLQRTTWHCC